MPTLQQGKFQKTFSNWKMWQSLLLCLFGIFHSVNGFKKTMVLSTGPSFDLYQLISITVAKKPWYKTNPFASPTKNPFRFAAQMAGLVATPALLFPPVLAAAGFGAAGPVVGSMAAAWQSSIGIVQGGSLFATMQSLAMGGGLGVFTATGVAGAGLTLASTVRLADIHAHENENELRNTYQELFRNSCA
jgi:hypothetical protein